MRARREKYWLKRHTRKAILWPLLCGMIALCGSPAPGHPHAFVDGGVDFVFENDALVALLDETVRMAGLTAEVAFYESIYFYAFAVTDLPKLLGSGDKCHAEVSKYDPSEQDEQLWATLARQGREETPSMANVGSLFEDRIALKCV